MLIVTLCAVVAACGGGEDIAAAPAGSAAVIAEVAASAPVSVEPAASSAVAEVVALAPTMAGSAPTDATATAVVTRPTEIRSQDLIAQALAGRPYSELGWKWSVECASQVVSGLNVPATGLLSSDLGDLWREMRFGSVTVPATTTPAFLMRVNQADAPIQSGMRCEMTASPSQGAAVPREQVFWYVVGLYLPDWVASTDETILTQWHSATGSIAMNPFMALSVRGDKLQLVLRHNANSPISRETTTSVPFTLPGTLPVNRWTYLTFKAKVSTKPDAAPFFQLWQDGVMVVDYQGLLGYSYVDGQFMKVGLYHWSGTSNPWPVQAPTRSVLVGNPTLVRDLTGRYKETDLRRLVAPGV